MVTRPSRSIPETRLIIGWAVHDEDEDEHIENEKDGKRKEKQQDECTVSL